MSNSLNELIEQAKEYILSEPGIDVINILHFGSSLKSPTYSDIDLCVQTKERHIPHKIYEKFDICYRKDSRALMKHLGADYKVIYEKEKTEL
jgi:hypothetical protein